jgi:hypothetical protein
VKLIASRVRPAVLISERVRFDGRYETAKEADDVAISGVSNEDEGIETTARPGAIALGDGGLPEDGALFYRNIVLECIDTIGMLARHRAERRMGELASNEAQLLAQVDAIAASGGDCVKSVLDAWNVSDHPWNAWACAFALASLEGSDALIALESAILTLPLNAAMTGERIAEALAVVPNPEIGPWASRLLRSPHAVARAIAIDTVRRRNPIEENELRAHLATGATPVMRAAARAASALGVERGVPWMLPLLEHPSLAPIAARALSLWQRPEPYFAVREGRPLAKLLGFGALEVLVQFGEANDLECFDTLVLSMPMSESILSAVARFGHPTSWAFLLHHLNDPDFGDAALDALETLFGKRFAGDPSALRDARAWRAAIARAAHHPALRYRQGEPWKLGIVANECTSGAYARNEVELRLDELSGRGAIHAEVDLALWSTEALPALALEAGKFTRADAKYTPGSWDARALRHYR